MKRNRTRVWLIDPEAQKVSECEDTRHIESLISEVVGDAAECYKLDNDDNLLWVSNTDTNSRYAYYFERMFWPFQCEAFLPWSYR